MPFCPHCEEDTLEHVKLGKCPRCKRVGCPDCLYEPDSVCQKCLKLSDFSCNLVLELHGSTKRKEWRWKLRTSLWFGPYMDCGFNPWPGLGYTSQELAQADAEKLAADHNFPIVEVEVRDYDYYTCGKCHKQFKWDEDRPSGHGMETICPACGKVKS